jgi:hypothetical protein
MLAVPISRIVAIGAIAVTATFGVAACGGGQSASKADVAAKLKSEPQVKGLSQKGVDCLARTLIDHGNKSDVKKYVDGKKKLDDVRQSSGNDKSVQEELQKCVKA